jgi:hypothetical protein
MTSPALPALALLLCCASAVHAADEATFACHHTGYTGLEIPKSKEGDGACDCCDCSDEELPELLALNQTCYPKFAYSTQNSGDQAVFWKKMATSKHKMAVLVHLPHFRVFEHGRIEELEYIPELPDLQAAIQETGDDLEWIVSDDDKLLQTWSNRGLTINEVATMVIRISDLKPLANDYGGQCLKNSFVMKQINKATEQIDEKFSAGLYNPAETEPKQLTFDTWAYRAQKAPEPIVLIEVYWSENILLERTEGEGNKPGATKEKKSGQSSLSNFLRQTYSEDDRVKVMMFDARTNQLPKELADLFEAEFADKHAVDKDGYGDAGAAMGIEWRNGINPGAYFPALVMVTKEPNGLNPKAKKLSLFKGGRDLENTIAWASEEATKLGLEPLITKDHRAFTLWARMGHKMPHTVLRNVTLMLRHLAINEIVKVGCILPVYIHTTSVTYCYIHCVG